MTKTGNVFDVIPSKDLDRISRLQEQAVELENRAFVLQARAQDLRVKAEDIVTSYQVRIRRKGWDACRAEAREQDMISWYFDPLPGQGAEV